MKFIRNIGVLLFSLWWAATARADEPPKPLPADTRAVHKHAPGEIVNPLGIAGGLYAESRFGYQAKLDVGRSYRSRDTYGIVFPYAALSVTPNGYGLGIGRIFFEELAGADLSLSYLRTGLAGRHQDTRSFFDGRAGLLFLCVEIGAGLILDGGKSYGEGYVGVTFPLYLGFAHH